MLDIRQQFLDSPIGESRGDKTPFAGSGAEPQIPLKGGWVGIENLISMIEVVSFV